MFIGIAYHAPMTIARPSFLLFLLLAVSSALAQSPDSAKFFDDARAQIADMRKQLGNGDIDDGKLNQFRDAAATLSSQADAMVAERTPALAAIDARLAELGPAPEKGSSEAADIAAQRADLGRQSTALDAEIKRAKLLGIDSQQLSGEIAEARRTNFLDRLSQRTASPWTPTFWADLAANASRDATRLTSLRNSVRNALADSFAPDNRLTSIAGIACGLLLALFGRRLAERVLQRLSAHRLVSGRLRRSAHAVALVAVATLFTGGGAQLAIAGLDASGSFSGVGKAWLAALISAIYIGSFVAGLCRALLSVSRPSWRLAPIPDALAQRLHHAPLLFGGFSALTIALVATNRLLGISLPATIATSCCIALGYGALIVWVLTRVRVVSTAESQAQPHPAWIGFTIAALWLSVIASFVAALSGYIAVAYLIAGQLVWLGIIVASCYLLVCLVEDLVGGVLSSRTNWAQRTLGLAPHTLDQSAVLFIGAFRVLIFVLAMAAALVPFGTRPADLLARTSKLGSGLSIGEFQLAPSAVFGAILVFALGSIVVRAAQRWFAERFLPTTRLEPAMRTSVSTILGYVGLILVVALALSELGLSLERIAWVASALSVGIGFGLQAVVQNFVSGLILLAERPVKVGDWVALGETEGDIRRIHVRATEIRMADHSTVIVPNSELITKSVRNVTRAGAEGRVRFTLPVALDSDPGRVREIALAVLAGHPAVLAQPAPAVLLDGIGDNRLVFVIAAFIANPRDTGSVRSDLLLELLAQLRTQGISLRTPMPVTLEGATTNPQVENP